MLLYMKLDYHTACAIVVIIGCAVYFIVYIVYFISMYIWPTMAYRYLG